MPVILEPAEWDSWLAPAAEPTALKALLRPFPANGLVADPVGSFVNSVKCDTPECVKPVELPATQGELF